MDRKLNNNGKQNQASQLDLVCLAHLRWDFVYQRPQHVMSRAANERRVFYVEEPLFEADEPRLAIRQDETGVTVVVPCLPVGKSEEEVRAIQSALIDELLASQDIEHYILWYYTPMAMSFTEHLQPDLILYDCMDELSAFNYAPEHLKEYEQQLLSRADLVFTGGYSLYEAKKDQHPNVHPFPSSIDVDHFKQARLVKPGQDPVDQYFIPHPRLGYFGVIDERINLDLIAACAQTHPEWQLVMVGPVAKIELKDLPQAPNIHYLNMKDYKTLPRYLAGWDVALMPFALNESTRFISPTKTPEYLAGGIPVVSTPIADVVNPYGEQGLVQIAGTPEDFVAAVKKLLEGKWDRSKWLKKVDAFLEKHSWDYTWTQMMQQVDTTLYSSHGTGSGPSIPVELNGRRNGNGRSPAFDYLIVGAGYAGSVLAERLAAGSGKRVLIIDRRPHIGGNAYDHFNPEGILVHKYGPHIFHTNSKEVFAYLSTFTEWRRYEHRVRASVDGQLVPMPINVDTINQLYGTRYTAFNIEEFYASVAEPRDKIITSEDVVISKVGKELYEKFFHNYTRKQWGLDPSELDASVTSRVPIRMNRDDRYFADTYQAMPLRGYTRMFERILDHPNIKIMLNTDYREIAGLIPFRQMIFTGPVDEYFDYVYGKLPYRSLDFKFETLAEERHQPVAVINYPNEHLYTRVTEFKHLSGQEHPMTTLVYEFPTAEGDPYYPIPRPENAALYARYQKLAESTPGVHFAGRLATYKYYNMDQVTGQALTLYAKIAGVKRGQASKQFKPKYVSVEARSV